MPLRIRISTILTAVPKTSYSLASLCLTDYNLFPDTQLTRMTSLPHLGTGQTSHSRGPFAPFLSNIKYFTCVLLFFLFLLLGLYLSFKSLPWSSRETTHFIMGYASVSSELSIIFGTLHAWVQPVVLGYRLQRALLIYHLYLWASLNLEECLVMAWKNISLLSIVYPELYKWDWKLSKA